MAKPLMHDWKRGCTTSYHGHEPHELRGYAICLHPSRINGDMIQLSDRGQARDGNGRGPPSAKFTGLFHRCSRRIIIVGPCVETTRRKPVGVGGHEVAWSRHTRGKNRSCSSSCCVFCVNRKGCICGVI